MHFRIFSISALLFLTMALALEERNVQLQDSLLAQTNKDNVIVSESITSGNDIQLSPALLNN